MEDEFLVLLHDDGEIDDEEFFILHEANRHRNLHGGLPYYKYERFNLEGLRDDECEVEFRFKKQDIYRLAAANVSSHSSMHNLKFNLYWAVDFKKMGNATLKQFMLLKKGVHD